MKKNLEGTKKTQQKGITLIALIITIIVLIILAGVVIVTLQGNNSAPQKATEAAQKDVISEAKDEIALESQKDLLDYYNNTYVEKTEGNATEGANTKGVVQTAASRAIGNVKARNKLLLDSSKAENYEITLKTKSYEVTGTIGENGGITWSDYQVANAGNEEDYEVADQSGANKPKIEGIANKTFVKWTQNAQGEYEIDDTLTSVPHDWYDYDNGKWANIKTTANGLSAYWVWIPRFEYVVPTTSSATKIDVKFIGTDVTSTNGKADPGYIVHPAFKFKDQELSGIWVGKFEACSENPYTLEDGGNYSGTKVQILPSIASWRSLPPLQMFTVCREMTQSGRVLEGCEEYDSHLMKNIEWGAVVILSQSDYGVFNPASATGDNGDRTKQVWNNPYYQRVNYAFDPTRPNDLSEQALTENDIIKTGCAAKTAGKDALETISCDLYNKGNGPKASTTGTVYGVYDMAGGANEYVAGCLSGYENTKFGVTAGDSTYVDIYTGSGNAMAKQGDATKETRHWNNDYGEYISSSTPVFLRGGKFSGGADAGTYCFAYGGAKHYYSSFRPVLAHVSTTPNE